MANSDRRPDGIIDFCANVLSDAEEVEQELDRHAAAAICRLVVIESLTQTRIRSIAAPGVFKAAQKAEESLRAVVPNGRDFSDTDWVTAREQHLER